MRWFVIFCGGLLLGQQPAQLPVREPAVLTLQEVVKLVKDGMSESVIIVKIKRNNKPFDLNSDEWTELKKSGVSDTIIKYLVDPSLPPPADQLPPPAVGVKPAPSPPKDPLVAKLPPELGVFRLTDAQPGAERFDRLEVKSLVPLNRSGLSSTLTAGLKKARKVGSLAGARAPVRAAAAINVYFARLGSKIAIEDVILVRMEVEPGRRVLDFGPKPEKPVFPQDAVLQFESKEAADGVYRLTVPPLEPGEYVFFVLGTGDERKGVLGKGYDLGVDVGRK